MIEDILDRGMQDNYKASNSNSVDSRNTYLRNALKYLGCLSLAVFVSSCAHNDDNSALYRNIQRPGIEYSKESVEISGKNYIIDRRNEKHNIKISDFTYDGEVLKKEDVKKGFQYDDDVSLLARHLINMGYFRNPEEFILTLRVGYFEGAFDSKAEKFSDLKKGLDGIYHVAKRRMDNQRSAGKESTNLFDILFRYNYNENNKKVYEFTCIGREERFFRTNLDDKILSMYTDRNLNIIVKPMGKERALLVLESLYDVLTEKVKDPTRGSTYYKNPEKCDSRNTDILWLLKGRVPVERINSHVFWKEIKDVIKDELASYMHYMEKRKIEPEKVLIANTPDKNAQIPYNGKALPKSDDKVAYVNNASVGNISKKPILIKSSKIKRIYENPRFDNRPVYYAKTPKKTIKERTLNQATPLYAVVGKKKTRDNP